MKTIKVCAGIHPFESRKYIRHIQINNQEQILQVLKKYVPNQIEKSWERPDREHVAFFPVTISDDALTLDDVTAIEFLELVKLTQNKWIEYGTNTNHPSYKVTPDLRMNVSNTVKVLDTEWDEVEEYLWNNREYFTGISLLSRMGDLAFRQAPYTNVIDEKQLAEMFGAGAILAGGLIVDGLKVFNNLWDATDAANGWADHLLTFNKKVITDYVSKNINDDFSVLINIDGVKVTDMNDIIDNLKNLYEKRNDWVRRFKKFACNYLDCNEQKTAECLKRVSIFHKWNQSINNTPIDWNSIKWEEVIKDAGSESASGCSGGNCEIVNI